MEAIFSGLLNCMQLFFATSCNKRSSTLFIDSKDLYKNSVSKLVFYAQSASTVISGRYKNCVLTKNTH